MFCICKNEAVLLIVRGLPIGKLRLGVLRFGKDVFGRKLGGKDCVDVDNGRQEGDTDLVEKSGESEGSFSRGCGIGLRNTIIPRD